MERKAQVIREYLARVSQRPELSEYARGVAFVQLLKDLLLEADPLFLQDYLQGMEHTLQGPKTALYNRGRVDALYGNLVIEFKRSLAKSLDEAREQLRKYLAALQQSPEDRRRPLIAIATDGIHFVAYAPRFSLDATTLAPKISNLSRRRPRTWGRCRPRRSITGLTAILFGRPAPLLRELNRS